MTQALPSRYSRRTADEQPAHARSATQELPQPSRIHAWRHDPDGASPIDVLMETSEVEMGQLRAGDVAVNRAGEEAGVHVAVEDARLAVNSDGKTAIIQAMQIYTHVGRRVDLDAVFLR